MNEQVESAYFNWLAHFFVDTRNHDQSVSFWNLFRILHGTEFVWILPMDENRADDGKDLRKQFILLSGVKDDPEWRDMPCSMLEMLVAFARRCEEATEVPARDWFWEMLRNLGLSELSDAVEIEPQDVAWILEQFMAREFDDHGNGGMFPLNTPKRDQRNVDIWYQFCDYLADTHRLP